MTSQCRQKGKVGVEARLIVSIQWVVLTAFAREDSQKQTVFVNVSKNNFEQKCVLLAIEAIREYAF